MNSSIIHDNTCSLIHKKCHPKSYHSDIKYRLTLNIIFSVLPSCFKYFYTRRHVWLPILYPLNTMTIPRPYLLPRLLNLGSQPGLYIIYGVWPRLKGVICKLELDIEYRDPFSWTWHKTRHYTNRLFYDSAQPDVQTT